MFRMDKDKELTPDILLEFITKAKENNLRFEELRSWYVGNHPIFYQKAKDSNKPDNRVAVNFAKYITDTFNGFFIGNPISTSVSDGNDVIAETIEFIEKYNDQDDNNAELAKLMSIYGKAYEMYFVDEVKNIGITYVDPREAFMIYDEGIVEEPIAFVHFYKNEEKEDVGSVSDATKVRYFKINSKSEVEFYDDVEHGFNGVPATEYIENEERMGLYESVISLMKAYDKAISEKANDVDYFADAYLLVKGPKLSDKDTTYIKNNRTINLFDESDDNSALPGMDARFIEKPNADDTQEHLLEKLERLIYTTSMVPDVNSTTFGSSSGIAMQYKLFNVRNLFKTKVRKFTSGMNRRWKLIFSHQIVSGVGHDDWVKLEYTFTPNIPANLKDEADTASTLSGIVSKYTQLKLLSCVNNVQEELDRIEKEDSQDTTLIQGLFDDHDHVEDVSDEDEEEIQE